MKRINELKRTFDSTDNNKLIGNIFSKVEKNLGEYGDEIHFISSNESYKYYHHQD